MGQCKKIYRKIQRICAGSLNRQIKIKIRSITAPSGSSVDYGENFQDFVTVWAMKETVNGVVTFDETNTAQNVTANYYIRYIQDVTFEKWLEDDGIYYNILTVTNLDGDNRFYKFQCNERGINVVNANLA